MATKSMAEVFSQNRYNLKDAVKQSRGWFEQQARLLAATQVTANRLMAERTAKKEPSIIPGYLYMFFYDAKHKATLDYWDKFPLVFPYKKTKNGFIGLNLHYLPYQYRIALLDKLMVFKNNDKMDESTKIRYSWATISGIAKFKPAEPCIHEYLFSHVKSKFRKVDSPDWTTALLLPVEQFVGKNKASVWAASRKMITS
jgi:hypothetical protein